MCIKIGNNEMDSVHALMTMSLNALLADFFNKDMDDFLPDLSLTRDLNFDSSLHSSLNDQIDEYFDGVRLDFSKIDTIKELFSAVVDKEFQSIPGGLLA